MKKLFLVFILVVSTTLANEIQVFTTNTMEITLENNTTFKKIFSGDYRVYKDNKKKIDSFIQSSFSLEEKEAYALATATFGILSKAVAKEYGLSTLNKVGDVNLVLAGGMVLTMILPDAYKALVKDYEYIYVSFATSNSQQTIIKTLIVSNDKLTLEEIERIGIKAQNDLLSL